MVRTINFQIPNGSEALYYVFICHLNLDLPFVTVVVSQATFAFKETSSPFQLLVVFVFNVRQPRYFQFLLLLRWGIGVGSILLQLQRYIPRMFVSR